MVDPAQLSEVRGRKIRIAENKEAFVPGELPPEIRYSAPFVSLLSESQTQLGRLDALANFVPSIRLFVIPSLRTEAWASTRIEGTRASMPEVFVHDARSADIETSNRDIREVMNYKMAMHTGLALLDELPVCNRLVKRVHRTLLEGTRGEQLTPGEFRTLQVEVGAYVPPPANYVTALMSEWEAFTSDPPDDMPVLVHSAIVHYQFEAIHPFFDGNGRAGRLLIPFLLCARGVLEQPLLSMSVYFEANRTEYFDRLLAVSEKRDWEGWICFFLRGVLSQAQRTVACCQDMIELRQRYLETAEEGSRSPNIARVVDMLFENPYITAPRVSHELDVTYQTGRNVLNALMELGIVEEASRETSSGAQIYLAHEVMELISGIAEPPAVRPGAAPS
ncbi:MAG: Fic family protein [Armatimonadota bacterium]